ncbi:hypothetical protein [Haladaptatus sp. ZSTT2]|uniref:hypothetical protein n=1 Tax=Haladaptatus sp. ZSTT2 TaxID=3120515 RepID=UPI00300F4104
MSRLRRALLSGVFVLLTSGVVSAHEVGGSRFEAPLPLTLLIAGAGVTVAVTAVWLGISARQPTAASPTRLTTLSAKLSRSLTLAGRVGFFALVVLAVFWGLFGKQAGAENPATVFSWWVWLKGVAIVSLLVGSPWRVLSPWRTLYRGLSRLEEGDLRLARYPAQLAHWPAVVGFLLVVGIFENLTAIPRDPQATATFVLGYTLVMVLGGVYFGDTWFERADFFAVLYRLFGRVSPVRCSRTETGEIHLDSRRPWAGCLDAAGDLSIAAFIIATVYTVSFDGFTSTPEFQSLSTGLRTALNLGGAVNILLFVAGFLGFLASYAFIVLLITRAGSRNEWRAAALVFAPTILPIAVAYELAHVYPFVLDNTGQFVALTLAGVTAGPALAISLTDWLSLPIFWGSQVLLIVVGHVVAVVAAHGVAIRRYETPTLAQRAHVPLVALMVGYTMLSLWIISRPVVTG